MADDVAKAKQVLREHADRLGLGDKAGITLTDQVALRDSLHRAGETGLAVYVSELKTPNELEDLLVNEIYG